VRESRSNQTKVLVDTFVSVVDVTNNFEPDESTEGNCCLQGEVLIDGGSGRIVPHLDIASVSCWRKRLRVSRSNQICGSLPRSERIIGVRKDRIDAATATCQV
jgi:hypothetical protein